MQTTRQEREEQLISMESYKEKILDTFQLARREMSVALDEHKIETMKIRVSVNKQHGVNLKTTGNFDVYQKFVVDAIKDLNNKKAKHEEELKKIVGDSN